MSHYIRRIISKLIHTYFEHKSRRLLIKGKVLMFHSIGGNQEDSFNIDTTQFEKLLRRLKSQHVIRLEDWAGENDFICLSIDDVPESFYHNAFPLLKQYDIPFTIFVATGLLGTEGYISINQLKEMASCNLCTVGSHGSAHGFYYKLANTGRFEELNESKCYLEKLTGKDVITYAFPYGSIYACGLRHKKEILKYYQYGFGTIQCPITSPCLLPDYYLPRINVSKSNINTL